MKPKFGRVVRNRALPRKRHGANFLCSNNCAEETTEQKLGLTALRQELTKGTDVLATRSEDALRKATYQCAGPRVGS